MSWWGWLLIITAIALFAVTAIALKARPRSDALGQLIKLIPPCARLIRDVLRDPQIPRHHKIVPAITLIYLANPIDLIPDFIPVLGHLDDALIVAWALRRIVRAAGTERVTHHWTGDPASLQRVLRLAGLTT
jgi:uncharacterized membrane protein YkvA (DUF1232 family)